MANSVMDLKKEIIRLRVALADTEALEIGTGERLGKVTAELESEKVSQTNCREALMVASAIIAEMHYAAMGEVIGPKRGVVEDVADLKAGCDALRHALDCENRRFAEAHVEIKQLRDALTTIGDARPGSISFLELQIFARNVLKGIEKCNT